MKNKQLLLLPCTIICAMLIVSMCYIYNSQYYIFTGRPVKHYVLPDVEPKNYLSYDYYGNALVCLPKRNVLYLIISDNIDHVYRFNNGGFIWDSEDEIRLHYWKFGDSTLAQDNEANTAIESLVNNESNFKSTALVESSDTIIKRSIPPQGSEMLLLREHLDDSDMLVVVNIPSGEIHEFPISADFAWRSFRTAYANDIHMAYCADYIMVLMLLYTNQAKGHVEDYAQFNNFMRSQAWFIHKGIRDKYYSRGTFP